MGPGIPTSNPGKEKQQLGRMTHPADTLACGDESQMNHAGAGRTEFRESLFYALRRIIVTILYGERVPT